MSHLSLNQTLQKYAAERREREQIRVAYQKRIAAFRQTLHPHSLHNSIQIQAVHSHSQQRQNLSGPHVSYQHPPQGLLGQQKQRLNSENNYQHSNKNLATNTAAVDQNKKHPQQAEVFPQLTDNELKIQEETDQSELEILLNQHKQLINQLVDLQTAEKNRLTNFTTVIQQIRDKYLAEFEKMKTQADQRTKVLHEKVLKIKLQIQATGKKNEELQKANQGLKSQILEGNQAMGKEMTQIKQTYAKKIEEVEKIFVSSNQKIESFQKEFNEDQLVENTISNEQFLINMEASAKQAQKGQGLLEEYKNLVGGKSQILDEIKTNNAMKEEELNKLSVIEKKMNDLAGRLKDDKNMLVKENEKLALQLQQITQLMMVKP